MKEKSIQLAETILEFASGLGGSTYGKDYFDDGYWTCTFCKSRVSGQQACTHLQAARAIPHTEDCPYSISVQIIKEHREQSQAHP